MANPYTCVMTNLLYITSCCNQHITSCSIQGCPIGSTNPHGGIIGKYLRLALLRHLPQAHQNGSRTTSCESKSRHLAPSSSGTPDLTPPAISSTSYLRHLHMFILAHPHTYLHFLSHLIIPPYMGITLFYTLGGRDGPPSLLLTDPSALFIHTLSFGSNCAVPNNL
jgi:hypothetical protein